MPDKWLELSRHNATSEAIETYIYDTPEDAVLKYLINFQLPHDIVDTLTSEMLEIRCISEASFCRELYMNEQQIRKLTKTGHIIGNHGHSHTPFSRLTKGDLENETQKSKSYFEEVTGRPQNWVSYPHGRKWALPQDIEDFCTHSEFIIGLGLDGGWNRGQESPYCLNRINENDVTDMHYPSKTEDF